MSPHEPLYYIICCETEIPIYADRQTECPECRTRFVVTVAPPDDQPGIF